MNWWVTDTDRRKKRGLRPDGSASRSGGGHRAAINDVVCTMNRSCTIGCEECHQFGDFLRLAGSANGNPSGHIHDLLSSSVLADTAALAELHNHAVCARSLDESRRDHVDADALRANFVCKALIVGIESTFRRSISKRRVIERQTVLDGRDVKNDT